MTALRLITFDVTGTLLKLQPIPAVVYSQNAKEFGITVSADAISSSFKTEWRKLSNEHPNFGFSGIGWQNWWKTFVKKTLVKADPALSYDDERLDKLSEFLIQEYKTAKWWRLSDGATDILDSLKRRNIPMGVISNYDPRLDSLLEAMKIKRYFKFVITSYTIGVMKPDEMIFRAAESQVPDIQPCNCLHVGNDIELDYKGATNAGWSAVVIDSKSSKSEEIPKQHIFLCLSDLKSELEKQNFKKF